MVTPTDNALYGHRRAQAEEIAAFTTASASDEAPEALDLRVRTEGASVEAAARPLVETLLRLSGTAD